MTVELNPRLSFDTYVIGAANRLAGTAAKTVAESPGTAYNPLLIYSASGLGKTHLLMAVGQLAQRLNPQLRVEYLTLDEFVEGYHAAVAAGHGEAFRHRFSGVDVLLVDDVQFLTHRQELQTELLRITAQLQATGKQIVLSSDRPPGEIENLDERLLQRFDGGLVVDIGAPDFETRRAILSRWAGERQAALAGDVLDTAAGFEVVNVRELLGLLNRLIAFQAVNETPLTPEQARSVLAGLRTTAQPAGAAPGAEPPPGGDEFAAFLTDVSSTVAQQVEAWRSTLGEAILKWEAEGYRTTRLEELVQRDVPSPGEHAVRDFERDIERLQALQRKMAAIDPDRAADPLFYDPDRVREAQALVERAREDIAPPPGPSEVWTLDGFVAGAANEVAVASARAVVAEPATRYNPLVLVGGTGVGKTHLLHATGHGLMAAQPAWVACLSAQQFSDELVQAIERDKVNVWRARYRRIGALLLDDLQLLAGKERSQEELFHLFNALADEGRQLVFTITPAPREVAQLDERLVSRLEGGLVVELGAPDRDLRREIVIRKLEERWGAAEAGLADYLAARPADSVRAVLGLLQRVLSAAEAQGVNADAAFARGLIEGATPPGRRTSGALRTSGVVASPAGGVHSREKMVWYWPDPAERVIEELS